MDDNTLIHMNVAPGGKRRWATDGYREGDEDSLVE